MIPDRADTNKVIMLPNFLWLFFVLFCLPGEVPFWHWLAKPHGSVLPELKTWHKESRKAKAAWTECSEVESFTESKSHRSTQRVPLLPTAAPVTT